MLFGFVLIAAINTEGRVDGMKLFEMRVDDIICAVCGDADEYLKFANSLHTCNLP